MNYSYSRKGSKESEKVKKLEAENKKLKEMLFDREEKIHDLEQKLKKDDKNGSNKRK